MNDRDHRTYAAWEVVKPALPVILTDSKAWPESIREAWSEFTRAVESRPVGKWRDEYQAAYVRYAERTEQENRCLRRRCEMLQVVADVKLVTGDLPDPEPRWELFAIEALVSDTDDASTIVEGMSMVETPTLRKVYMARLQWQQEAKARAKRIAELEARIAELEARGTMGR